jgi:hypothetical protein
MEIAKLATPLHLLKVCDNSPLSSIFRVATDLFAPSTTTRTFITGAREVPVVAYYLDYGVFGDGNNKSPKSPIRNEYFDYLRTQNLHIEDIKSCNNYSLALMSDGQLYGWGSNENG